MANFSSKSNCCFEIIFLFGLIVLEFFDFLQTPIKKFKEIFCKFVDVNLGATEFEELSVTESSGNNLLPSQMQEGSKLHFYSFDVLVFCHSCL